MGAIVDKQEVLYDDSEGTSNVKLEEEIRQ